MGFARQDLEQAAEFVTSRKGGDGYLRGVDYYADDVLPQAYARATRNFCDAHHRLPDVTPPRFSQEHVFLSKFFRYFPTTPNPAAKHNNLAYLSEALREKVLVPNRVVVDTPGDLRRLKVLPGKKVFIKPSLGNDFRIEIDGGTFRRNRLMIARNLRPQYRRRYGVSWGEWIYGVGDQRILVEEDLSEVATEDEYQFYVRQGRVRMFRKARGLVGKHADPSRVRQSYFDRNGTYFKGALWTTSEIEDRSLPDTIDLMLEVAEDIGARFDAIRVDFIETTNGIVLGELSCFPGNARFEATTPGVEALYVDAASMTG